MKKAYFNWSSGKDSSLALYYALQSGKFTVEALFSILKSDCKKISMHEIGVELLKRQAEAIGIPLTLFYFDPTWSEETYQSAIKVQMDRFKGQNITTALFGDLHLESLRRNREAGCRQAGINAEFPLWNIPQEKVMTEFLRLGFKTIVTCVNHAVLSEMFLGQVIDENFLSRLPTGVDICGENGEYHSFVFDGPIFKAPVPYEIKGTYRREFPGHDGTGIHRYDYLELG